MFNRRREGEVSRMKLSDYDKRKECAENSEISESLSKLEKSLCKLLTRIEICGKGGRNVPVLPTPSMKSSIDILRKYRKEVGVWEENEFLFASCSNKAKYHYRGSDCLRKFAEECGAEKADLLRSTKLRKHMATMSQILNLQENELESLARFMGHDIRIHRDFYRLSDTVHQTAKLSKIFLSLEKEEIVKHYGKSLEEM